jgi:hypothetical protein
MDIKPWVLALGLTALSGTAQASILTFDGNICGGGTSCSNGENIDQSYGDTAGVNVIYDGSASGGLQDFLYWYDGYSDLFDVAYYTAGATLTFLANAGYDVFLDSLDLGAWPFADREVGFSVTDLADNSEVYSTGGPVLVDGDVHSHFVLGLASTVGLQITFVGDFYNGGVDNVVYNARTDGDPSAIPLPAGAWLLGTALFGLVAARRRKS